ncbi:MAG: TonB-dependent siderophore receptor [Methylococcaceae bacterium]|nr:TonB-dependent siderophore receptor [Methylococcaceae bacterium]
MPNHGRTVYLRKSINTLYSKATLYAVTSAWIITAAHAEQVSKPLSKEKAEQAQVRPTQNEEALALPIITVYGDVAYDANDPYDKHYSVPNATTATKTDSTLMDTPVSIQVVPKALINDQQDIAIEDALQRNVSGMQREAVSLKIYDSYIVRGFSSADQMYRNGFRRTMGVYDMANIEQIEVLKGPASVLYGRVQPGGMVNYVTKKALDTPYYMLQQQFGSYDLYRTSLDATGPLDHNKTVLYRFNASYLDSGSFRNFNDREDVFIAPRLTWRPNDRFEANLEMEKRHDNYMDDTGVPVFGKRPAPVARSLWTGDPAYRSELDNTLLSADWRFNFNTNWAIQHKFQWDETETNFNLLFVKEMRDYRTGVRGAFLGGNHQRSYGTSLDLTGNFETLRLKHQLLIGGDYFFFNRESPSNKILMPYKGVSVLSDIDIYQPQYGTIDTGKIDNLRPNYFLHARDDWYGVYFQDQITLWDDLHIMGGGRYDMSGYGSITTYKSWQEQQDKFAMSHENHFSPRVGVLYQPWQWLSVYGNYVESFGSNNGNNVVTGRNFAPQLGEQYEIGIKNEFFDQKLTSSIAYYHLVKSNLLVYDQSTPDPNDQIALGMARSQGIEVDIKGQLNDDISVLATYAYTDARVTEGNIATEGKRLPSVPDHQASLWGVYQFGEHFKAGLGTVIAGQKEGDVINSYQLPGYARMDAMLAYVQPLGKTRLTAQINVNNLLNKKYFYGSMEWLPDAHYGAPISAMGSLKLEY